jgi:seryl-tRNA(Sec) selenium transferase
MQKIDPKVMVAISAAIGAYLEEEAAAMAMQQAAAAAPPFATVNLWAIAGRMDMMLQRRSWQMRMY